jgi:hypothetical protein
VLLVVVVVVALVGGAVAVAVAFASSSSGLSAFPPCVTDTVPIFALPLLCMRTLSCLFLFFLVLFLCVVFVLVHHCLLLRRRLDIFRLFRLRLVLLHGGNSSSSSSSWSVSVDQSIGALLLFVSSRFLAALGSPRVAIPICVTPRGFVLGRGAKSERVSERVSGHTLKHLPPPPAEEEKRREEKRREEKRKESWGGGGGGKGAHLRSRRGGQCPGWKRTPRGCSPRSLTCWSPARESGRWCRATGA